MRDVDDITGAIIEAAPALRDGLRRIVDGFQPSAFPRLRVNQTYPGNAQGSH